jgi:hypothetical protein
MIRFFLVRFTLVLLEFLYLPLLLILSLLARLWPKKVEIGLGPEPLINNVYLAKALRSYGWKAETFVDHVYFITSEFDIKFIYKRKIIFYLTSILYINFIFSIFRYKIIYIYFNGGGLFRSQLLWLLEPFLYHLAGVKVVVMPYGGDVQVMQKSQNLPFKHAVDKDYPQHFRRQNVIRQKVWLWSRYADHVISGCDWVDYMEHWDTLCLAHFSIDLDKINYGKSKKKEIDSFKILHAPNHKEIKGTVFFENAVRNLQKEGFNIELIMAQGLPNEKIQELIQDCDIVADQLIIGWYAMFAIEGMAAAKPVLCFLRDDLKDLYYQTGILDSVESIPIINCNPQTVTDTIRNLLSLPKEKLFEHGLRGRKFVEKYHSLYSIGGMFDIINRKLGANKSIEI